MEYYDGLVEQHSAFVKRAVALREYQNNPIYISAAAQLNEGVSPLCLEGEEKELLKAFQDELADIYRTYFEGQSHCSEYFVHLMEHFSGLRFTMQTEDVFVLPELGCMIYHLYSFHTVVGGHEYLNVYTEPVE